MYAVMLVCRTGVKYLSISPFEWRDTYHTITWCAEEDRETAEQTARELAAGNPREVVRSYVAPWNKRFGGLD